MENYVIMELFLDIVGFKEQMKIYQCIPTLCQLLTIWNSVEPKLT
jgi:hypothetical protein